MANAAHARTPSALSLSDLNTTVNHEPRVEHAVIAARLGTRAQETARLIERNRAELEGYGDICVTVTQNTDPKGRGRPGKAYWLNEGQALVICALSRTPAAAGIRREVIEVFMAYRRGELSAPRRPLPNGMSARDLDAARRLVAECRKTYGPYAAQRMWRDMGLPGAAPDQDSLALSAPEGTKALKDGQAFVVHGGRVLAVDLRQRIWRRGEDVLAVQSGKVVRVRLYQDAGHMHGRAGEVRVDEASRWPVVAGVTILGLVVGDMGG